MTVLLDNLCKKMLKKAGWGVCFLYAWTSFFTWSSWSCEGIFTCSPSIKLSTRRKPSRGSGSAAKYRSMVSYCRREGREEWSANNLKKNYEKREKKIYLSFIITEIGAVRRLKKCNLINHLLIPCVLNVPKIMDFKSQNCTPKEIKSIQWAKYNLYSHF